MSNSIAAALITLLVVMTAVGWWSFSTEEGEKRAMRFVLACFGCILGILLWTVFRGVVST